MTWKNLAIMTSAALALMSLFQPLATLHVFQHEVVDKCAAGAVAGFCIEDLAGHLGKRRAMGFLNTGTVVSIEIYLIIPPSLSPEILFSGQVSVQN
jgi:hypothetical protein